MDKIIFYSMTHPNPHFVKTFCFGSTIYFSNKNHIFNKTPIYSLKHWCDPPKDWSYCLHSKNLSIATSVALSLPEVALRITPLDAGCIRQCRSHSLDQSWRVHRDKAHPLPSQATMHTPLAVKPRQSHSVPHV